MSSGSDVSEEILEEIQDEEEPSSFSVSLPLSNQADDNSALSWGSPSRSRGISSPIFSSEKEVVRIAEGEPSRLQDNGNASKEAPKSTHQDCIELSKDETKGEEKEGEKQLGKNKRVSFPPKYLALDEIQNKSENRQSDDSPMASEWSVESLKSSGSSGFHIEDRSLSELSVSVPKLTVVSIDKEQKVHSLVKQFSEQSDAPEFLSGSKRRQSVPLYGPSTQEHFSSLQPNKEVCDPESKWHLPGRRTSVSSIVSYFSSQQSEDTSAQDIENRKSPLKLGQMSPRIRNSLEKITNQLSQCSTQDLAKDTIERGILKSKENVSPRVMSRRSLSFQQLGEKENSPVQTSIELEELQDCEEDIEELLNIAFSGSKTASCSESQKLTKGKSSEKSMTSQETFDRKDVFHGKLLDTCDTDEEIEDMPEERRQSQHMQSTMLKDISSTPIVARRTSVPLCFPSWDVDMSSSSQQQVSSKSVASPSVGNIPRTLADSNKRMSKSDSKLLMSPVTRSSPSVDTASLASDAFRDTSECSESLQKSEDNGGSKSDYSEVSRASTDRSGNEESRSADSDSEDSEEEHSHGLLEVDIEGSEHDAFDGEFSEASEVILGFLSNSPISAITERTEESGQDNNPNETRKVSDSEDSSNLQDSVGEYDNECQNAVQAKTTSASAIPSPQNRGNFPSLPLMDNTMNSSQFANSHSLQENVSPVQTQPSQEAGNDSSQNPTSAMAKKSVSVGVKPKLGKFPVVPRGQKAGEKHCTVSPSPTSKSPSTGPVKATLCRNTSKSMHNLGTSASSKASRGQGLSNRSLSLSTDNLENNSPRSSSLSPALCKGRRNSGSSLHRRCISAIALNEGESQFGMKRNKSLSLSRLNRSRSSSMNSISSCKKADYSHIQSKVKQYIKDVKERDMRNSTRSLPSTPLRRAMSKSEEVIMINERMLNEFSDLKTEDLPEDLKKLKSKVLGEGGDLKVLENILRVLLEERKSRHASDSTLAALQLRFDNLNARYAEKQNEIDRLRFYKDIHINKDFTITLRSQEEGRTTTPSNWTSRNTTPVNTPYRSLGYYDTSPNTPQRRSSCHMTPPNTPIARSLSPCMTPNIVKSTSTPMADPLWSFALEPSSSYTCQDSLPVDPSSGDQEKSKNTAKSPGQDVNLQTWMKETNSVLQKIKDFTVLQGHGAVEQSERNIIWQHILQEYWRMAALFPVLTLVSPTQEPGILLQKLGKALQVTASRFDLELNIGKHQEHADGTTLQCSDTKEIVDQLKKEPNAGVTAGKGNNRSLCAWEKGKNDKLPIDHGRSFSTSEQYNLNHGDLKRNDNSPEHSPLKQENRATKLMKTVDDQVTLKITRSKDFPVSQGQKNKKNAANQKSSATETRVQKVKKVRGITRMAAEHEAIVVDSGLDDGKDLPANLETEVELHDLCSPAHSRESMKTVGPLEKVKLWQDSLIGSLPAPGEYQSPPNTSGPPSILSVESSESFHPEDLNDHLVDLKLDDINPGCSGLNINQAVGPSDAAQIVSIAQGSEVGHSLPQNSLDRPGMEGDVPKSPWRSNSVTPRLPWSQTVKARDLDSGCPGSERSTRMSHNASFEHPDQGSNYHPSLEATRDLDESEQRERSLTYEVVDNKCLRACEDRGMNVESLSHENVKYVYAAKPKLSGEGYSCEERHKLKESNQYSASVESRVRSGCSRSSRNSSKIKRDSQHGKSGLKDASNEHFSESWARGSPQRVLEKMYSVHDKGLGESTGEESSDCNRSRKRDSKVGTNTRKRSRSRRSFERGSPGVAKCPCGGQSEARCDTPDSHMQEVSDKLNASLGKIDAINKNLRKYRSKYIGGYASNLSDDSTSSHSSHLDIYSNISRLKRDFKILQSQMLNLKSEVFHEKKTKESSKIKNTKHGRNVPMRALDLSKCRDEYSSMEIPQSEHKRLNEWDKLDSSRDSKIRHRTPTSSKYFDVQSKHSDSFSDSHSISGFDDSKMEGLAKSTPKDKVKKGTREGSKRDSNTKKSNRSLRLERHETLAESHAKRQLNLSEIEVIEIQSPRNRPTSTQTVSIEFCTPQHIGVQTEERQIPVITCNHDQLQTESKEEYQTCQTQLSDGKSDASGQLSPRYLNASAPFVYIHTYNHGSDLSRAVSEGDLRAKKQNTPKRKHRRAGSSQQLINSLDEVTSIAERVRLRSESMLSCLDLNISVRESTSKF